MPKSKKIIKTEEVSISEALEEDQVDEQADAATANEDEAAALLSPEEKEIRQLLIGTQTMISSENLKMNNDLQIKFVKFPSSDFKWSIIGIVVCCSLIALKWQGVIEFKFSYHKLMTVLLYFSCSMMILVAGLCLTSMSTETVEFDKSSDILVVKRRDLFAYFEKTSFYFMTAIRRVHAARRDTPPPKDTPSELPVTSYLLIITMDNGQEIKLLETQNPMQIRKELIVVRKFLEMEDEVPCIFDEIKRKQPIDHQTGKVKKLTIQEKKTQRKICQQKRDLRQRLGRYGDRAEFQNSEFQLVQPEIEATVENEEIQVVAGDESPYAKEKLVNTDFTSTSKTAEQISEEVGSPIKLPKRQLPARVKAD